ncbi:MAG: hypothetical protein WBY44_10530, partial [Bryobacteraceae bacterium]
MKCIGRSILLLSVSIPLFGSSPLDCEKLFELEQHGEFKEADAAYRQADAKLCGLNDSHAAKLRSLAVLEKSMRDNPHLMNAERAQDLRAFMKQLDAQSDEPLIQGAYVLLDKLTISAQSFADSPVGRFLLEFGQSARLHPEQLPQTIATQLFAVAIRGVWIILIIAFGAWRLWPRKGIQISFEDITAEESRKPAQDRILMQDVQQAFWIPRTELTSRGPEGLELAPVKDHDASGFGNLVPQRPLIPWSDVVQSGTPIKIGSVAFDLKQLLLFILSPLQIRRRYSLTGFVHEFEKRTIIMAQEVDWKGRQLRGRSWKAEGEPNGNRREVIHDLTAQIIVDLKVSEITTDWRSYRSFCQGLDSLSAADTAENRGHCQCVESARNYFQTALGFDSANWMARFYLAVSLCRCGESETAVNHFSILKRTLSESDALLGNNIGWLKRLKEPSNRIVRHIRQYPQCPFLVLYNLAMALSGTLRSCELNQALGTLEKISQAVDRKPGTHVDFGSCADLLREADRDRFAMLALSARTSILAMQMEYELRQKEVKLKLAELQSKVQATADEFEAKFKVLRPELTLAHGLAHATMLNAQGRAAFARFTAEHRPLAAAESKTFFEKAAACLPDLVDSYINLARLYLSAKDGVSENWIAEAGKQIRIAEHVSPGNTQVKYLQAKLASTAEVKDYADGLKKLDPVPDSAEKFFIKAEILSNPGFPEHDINAAIAAWQKAIDLLSAPNQAEVVHLQNLFHHARMPSELAGVL